MGHIHKGTCAPTVEWAKHLRPFGKRRQAKAERAANKKQIQKENDNSDK